MDIGQKTLVLTYGRELNLLKYFVRMTERSWTIESSTKSLDIGPQYLVIYPSPIFAGLPSLIPAPNKSIRYKPG